MKCVIEGSAWHFDTSRSCDELELFESVLDLLDDVSKHSEVFYSEDLFRVEVVDGYSFYDLYNEAAPVVVPRQIQERVAAAFLRLQRWEDENQWPADTEASIDGKEPTFLPSVCWAHAVQRESRDPTGVIVFSSSLERGSHEVKVVQDKETLFFMKLPADWALFNRHCILAFTKNSTGLKSYSSHAFPKVEFLDGALDGIHNMSRPYPNLIREVVSHLTALNDHGPRIFQEQSQKISSLFGSVGVEISDENGSTKSNSEARKQRTRIYQDREIIFWWHSKIERHRDRIHIYFNNGVDGVEIIVGILCRHLDV